MSRSAADDPRQQVSEQDLSTPTTRPDEQPSATPTAGADRGTRRSRRARDVLHGRRTPRRPLSVRGRRMLARMVARTAAALVVFAIACVAVVYAVTATSFGSWFTGGLYRAFSPWITVEAPRWVDQALASEPNLAGLSDYEQGLVSDLRQSVRAIQADGIRSYLVGCVNGTLTPASDEAATLVDQARQLMVGDEADAAAEADADAEATKTITIVNTGEASDSANASVVDGGAMAASDAVWSVTKDLSHDPEAVERLFPEAQKATGFDYSEMDLLYWEDPDASGRLGSVSYRVFGDGHVERCDSGPYVAVTAALAVCGWIVAVGGVLAIIVLGIRRPLARYDALFQAIVALYDDPRAMPDLPPELDEDRRLLSDIRERNEADEIAARAAEQRKDELVAYLAHDIKTPLTAVTGYLTLLEEAPDMPEGQRARYASLALDKAYRLDGMLDEFFDIARYNLGQLVVEREHVDLALFCHQVADEFFPEASDHHLTISVSAPEGVEVYADAAKLFRAVSNVMKNAVAFADEGSVVELEAVVDEPDAQDGATVGEGVPSCGAATSRVNPGFSIVVRDHGREIASEHLDRIFDRFFREDAARPSRRGGAGLGLAIAREIARAHGGDIVATSDAGVTTFTLTIPGSKA
ncbi:HAMP domain-containing sensor histidine kinase [Collinsella sp. An2]|uniref:sensor histidine kinase n=1 Tax=Collinsella sp. An2 TaxID=1965585 RepID=UPI000B36CF5A|nr:HAMP domain-containing sensor histidine kinase [Collinsella sp. An2]OUP09186.1 hypothetical protein B5F33_05495 [Collinsella sp. An2]